MSGMIINLEPQNYDELASMFRQYHSLETTEIADSIEGPFLGGLPDLDTYIHCCIGTFRRLEDHQANGGHLYLGYPDGSLREMRVSGESAGVDLPSVGAPPSQGVMRTIRRRLR